MLHLFWANTTIRFQNPGRTEIPDYSRSIQLPPYIVRQLGIAPLSPGAAAAAGRPYI
jgi:hypothetical protein